MLVRGGTRRNTGVKPGLTRNCNREVTPQHATGGHGHREGEGER
jgi:hypothetical protein